MFLGPGITTVFACRWKALMWSAGVLLTAYCSIPAPDDTAASGPEADSAVATVTQLMGGGAPADADSHVSPWAISSPKPAAGK